MKSICCVSILMMLGVAQMGYAQAPQQAELSPRWLALSVADLAATQAWYQEHLGFEVFDKMELPERNIYIAFIRNGDFIIELAQLPGSIDPAAQTGETRKSKIRGVYKFGFMVGNINERVAQMRAKGVSFQGDLMEDKRFGVKTILVKDHEGNLIQLFEKIPQ